MTARPRVLVTPGDANGIGPELTAKLLGTAPTDAEIVLLGDENPIRLGEKRSGVSLDLFPVKDDLSNVADAPPGAIPFLRRDNVEQADIRPGEVSAVCGRAAIGDLEFAAKAVQRGLADGVLFAPLNKAAMKAGGMKAADELHHLAAALGFAGPISEVNIFADGPWTSRVTSHVALRDVADLLSAEKITRSAWLIHAALRDFGTAAPRIAIAALNPHAGDGGNFGREEIDLIAPTVADLRRQGMDASGPHPADTLFMRALAGEFDAVVTMYHDQGQIALKLMGIHRSASVQGGLPVPVATPAHGTAFDIVGQGIAKTGATEAAYHIVRRMAANRKARGNAAT